MTTSGLCTIFGISRSSSGVEQCCRAGAGSNPVSGFSAKALCALIATGLALVLVSGGCAGDDGDDEQEVRGRVQPKLVESTAVAGGRPRERALLRQVLRGMEKTTLTRAVIGPDEGRREIERGAAVPIAFTLAAGGPSVRRQWEQWIVAGAFSRRLDAAGLSAEVDASDPKGAFTARPKLSGQPDPRPLTRRQERAVVQAIRRAARRSGGNLVRLEVHQPYGAAVAIAIAAEDPARFLKEELRPLISRLDAQRAKLEGMYLAVLDGDRQLALEWGAWTRNPAGSYWVRRDLANCSPIEQSEPPGTEPPPDCPA
jgi:hypothetical protein